MFCAAIEIYIPATKLLELNKAESKMVIAYPSTSTSLQTILKIC